MTKIERNYWPHAIVSGIVFVVIACGFTIKIAMDNPVEMDSYYLEKYQSVDANINDILEKQAIFDKNYKIEHDKIEFAMGSNNKVEFSIKDKNNNTLTDEAKVRLVISRPETNKYNQEFIVENGKDGKYSFEGINFEKPGRWQVLTRISIKGMEGYNKYEVIAAQ